MHGGDEHPRSRRGVAHRHAPRAARRGSRGADRTTGPGHRAARIDRGGNLFLIPDITLRSEGLAPGQVYQWRKQLLGSAEAVFAAKKKENLDPQVEKFRAQSQRMKNVIAEITAENLDLKKTLSD